MNLSLGAKTDPGKRANNEDFLTTISGREKGLCVDAILIVADGMGGRNFGEQASETAGTVSADVLCEMLAEPQGREIPIQDAIGTALRKANAAVYELSRAEKEYEGMGTTCVIAVITEDRLFVGHAGDSRGYIIHGSKIERVTNDHSFVGEQVRAGTITEEHAKRSRFRNVITRAVGIEPTIEPDIVEMKVDGIQAVMLCTDGLSNELSDEDMERILLRSRTSQEAANRLVDLANRRGGHDNITATVALLVTGPIEVPAEGAPEEEEFFRAPKSKRPNFEVSSTILLSVLLAIASVAAILFGQTLLANGFQFTTQPPFVAPPAVPKPPSPPNYKLFKYGALQVLPDVPIVRDEPLSINPKTHSITVETADGHLLTISPDDVQETKFKLPDAILKSQPAVNLKWDEGSAVPTEQHFAVDQDGNAYFADSGHRAIIQMDPAGRVIRLIAKNQVTHPTAIAVSDIGNIYVINANRLAVVKATPPAPATP
jgi:protein phosphatase